MLTRRALLQGAAASVSKPKRKPNLLFILADDHAGFAMGADGHPDVQTPHIDQLAGESVRFASHFCNAPVCTPSRQSLLMGVLPHATGVTVLPTSLNPESPTLAKQLRKAGYRTGVIGKMHFNRICEPGMYGFDEPMADGAVGQAMGGRKARKVDASIAAMDLTRGPSHRGDYRWLYHARYRYNAEYLPFPRYYEDMPGTFMAREAVRFLEEHRDEPVALWVSFFEPHSPFRFPVDMRGIYEPESLPVPEMGPEDAPQVPVTFRDLTKAEYQGINAAYFNSVSFLDRNIGELMAGVKRLGLDEETLVIYTADHGFLLGHHGRTAKHCGYDEALRVPLLVRKPGQFAPGVVSSLTQGVDVPATVIDLLDLPPLPALHGESLRPTLEGKAATGRKAIFSEYLENEEAYLRTEIWKFWYCTGKRYRRDGYETDNPTPGRTIRLYDLKSDPGEFRSVAAQYPGKVKEFTEQMLEVFRATHPEAVREPSRGSVEERLDWYLRPRDAKAISVSGEE